MIQSVAIVEQHLLAKAPKVDSALEPEAVDAKNSQRLKASIECPSKG